jgi:hypothetical protein
LHWHWKAFIENKVDAYMSQVQALEDYVASTVQAFTGQVSALIKSLSDTMLAAVGALLGSFIAALFKDKFDPTIFVIGMLIYAQRLYPENVDEIVGGQVAKSRRHFRRWFWATILAYAVVVFAAVMTAVLVPGQSVLKDAFQFCSRLVAGFFAIPQKP